MLFKRHFTDPRRISYTERGATIYTRLHRIWASLCHISWHSSVVVIYCKKGKSCSRVYGQKYNNNPMPSFCKTLVGVLQAPSSKKFV